MKWKKAKRNKPTGDDPGEAQYSWVKDSGGNVHGMWLRDPGKLDATGYIEVLLVEAAPHLLQTYLAKQYRKVPNNYDSQGGCFIMFSSAKAPGES